MYARGASASQTRLVLYTAWKFALKRWMREVQQRSGDSYKLFCTHSVEIKTFHCHLSNILCNKTRNSACSHKDLWGLCIYGRARSLSEGFWKSYRTLVRLCHSWLWSTVAIPDHFQIWNKLQQKLNNQRIIKQPYSQTTTPRVLFSSQSDKSSDPHALYI